MVKKIGILLPLLLGIVVVVLVISPHVRDWWVPPPRAVSLLRISPEQMSLKSRFRDFRTEVKLEWTVFGRDHGLIDYVWRGMLDSHPEFPGVVVMSGTHEIEPLPKIDLLSGRESGTIVHSGSTIETRLQMLRVTSEEPMTVPIRIPDASTQIRFEARAMASSGDELKAILSIGDDWEQTFPLSSPDWSLFVSEPLPLAEGEWDLTVQVKGVRPGDRDVHLRELSVFESNSIGVRLPKEAPPPRVFHRPRDPMRSYLTDPIADFGSPPEPVDSPWGVYDEDPRWVLPVEIQRTVRTSLFLPSPSEWSVRIDYEPGSVLRFYPGVQNPIDPAARSAGILRVHLESDGGRRLLWEETLRGTELEPSRSALHRTLQPWQVRMKRVELDQIHWRKGVDVELPPMPGVECRLVFESAEAPDEPAPAPVFLGEPKLLPPPRLDAGSRELIPEDILDWNGLLDRLVQSREQVSNKPERRIWLDFDWQTRVFIGRSDPSGEIEEATRAVVLQALNKVLANPALFPPALLRSFELPIEASRIRDTLDERTARDEVLRLNRSVLDTVFLEEVRPIRRFRPTPKSRPNIVLISLDTLRADALSCLGYHRETTPWMRGFFGDEGVRFRAASAPSTWTLPSHASLFVSQYVARHGVTRDTHSLVPTAETLAEFLSENGYETAAFVDRGFLHHHYGLYQGFHLYNQKGGGFGQLLPECLDYLESRDRTAPLFLFLHTFDIHDPYLPPHPYRERFLFGDMAPSRTDFTVPHADTLHAANKGLIELSRDDRDYARALYDGGVVYVDDLLRNFFKKIETRRLLENSVVVLLSDHGEGFGEHGFWGHGWTLYEEMTRVPLLIRFPGSAFAGTEIDERVNLVDVAPTLADLLELPAPDHWQGDSLMPLIRNPSLKWERRTYSQLNQTHTMYHGFLKLIEQREPIPSKLNPERMPPLAVYDLSADPDELQNLIHAPPIDASLEFERLAQTMSVMRGQREAEGEVGEVQLDEEQVEELRALGYLK